MRVHTPISDARKSARPGVDVVRTTHVDTPKIACAKQRDAVGKRAKQRGCGGGSAHAKQQGSWRRVRWAGGGQAVWEGGEGVVLGREDSLLSEHTCDDRAADAGHGPRG